MIGAGVGRSGSPTPRLITSRPAAMAAFFFLSISANRYGGSFWSRSDFTNGVAIVSGRPVLESMQSGADQRGNSIAIRRHRDRGGDPVRRHRLLGDVVVGVDVLDVVVLVEDVAELEHLLAVLDVEVDVGGGDVAGLGALGGDPVLFEGLADGLEDLGVAGDLEVAVDELDVVGAGLEGDLHQAVLGDVLGVDDEQALEVEQVADAAAGAEVAAADLERLAELAGGPVAVVGQDLAEDGHAAGAVALVDDLLEVLGAELAGRLLDRALDVVLGAAERAGLVDRVAEPQVRGGVAAAVARRRRSRGRAC